jgi:hypothetical protein
MSVPLPGFVEGEPLPAPQEWTQLDDRLRSWWKSDEHAWRYEWGAFSPHGDYLWSAWVTQGSGPIIPPVSGIPPTHFRVKQP